MPASIAFEAVLQRKDARLPVYVVVPQAHVAPWGLGGTTIVEGTVDGHDLGRRSLKRWSNQPSADWFLEFTAAFCKAASLQVGDRLKVSLRLADSAVPEELAVLLSDDAALLAQWNQLSAAIRRASQEHILAARSAATRSRRAAALVAGLRVRQRG